MIEIKSIEDLVGAHSIAQQSLNVTQEDTEMWLQARVTKHFTLELIKDYCSNLLRLKTVKSGDEAERIRGEIRYLEKLINKLTETKND